MRRIGHSLKFFPAESLRSNLFTPRFADTLDQVIL